MLFCTTRSLKELSMDSGGKLLSYGHHGKDFGNRWRELFSISFIQHCRVLPRLTDTPNECALPA